MAPQRSSQYEDDASRGLTLRELVLRIESKVDGVADKVDAHLNDHERQKGVKQGEATVLGIGRSALSMVIAMIAAAVSVLAGLHIL